MSADGVPIEEIARLAGHNRTATTELVYPWSRSRPPRLGRSLRSRRMRSAVPTWTQCHLAEVDHGPAAVRELSL
jgi:hypothetical protein